MAIPLDKKLYERAIALKQKIKGKNLPPFQKKL